jgi:hypothetical protein
LESFFKELRDKNISLFANLLSSASLPSKKGVVGIFWNERLSVTNEQIPKALWF